MSSSRLDCLRAVKELNIRFMPTPTEHGIITAVNAYRHARGERPLAGVRKVLLDLYAWRMLAHAPGYSAGHWRLTPKGEAELAGKETT